MQSILKREVKGDEATIGAIGLKSRNIIVSPPLTQFSFNLNSDFSSSRVLINTSTSIGDCIELANDERSVAYTTANAIKLVDLQTGREIRNLLGHNAHIDAVVQSNRSTYVWASASSDCSMVLWDTRQHPANVQIHRFKHPINCARFSPNDGFIALGSDHLYMLDPRIGEIRSLVSLSQVMNLCFHPSEYLMAAAYDDRLVRFWDIDLEECVSQSDPADSVLREIAFHSDGSALLLTTDRKCSAVSWEPYEILGQCSILQSDYSMRLAASDIDVFVLGRSVASNSVSLLSSPYAKLLTHEQLSESDKDSPESISPEINTDINYVEFDHCSNTNFYSDNAHAFRPFRALARTPPPKLPASDEKFSVTMTTTSGPTAVPTLRPKTLKTQQNSSTSRAITTGKKVAVPTIARSSRNGLPIRRGTKVTKATGLKETLSTPDVRFNGTNKRSESSIVKKVKEVAKEKIRLNRTENDKEYHGSNKKLSTDLSSIIDNLAGGFEKLEIILSQRRNTFDKILQCWRTRGSEGAISEAERFNDPAIMVELMDTLNRTPNAWTLSVCASVLPHVEELVRSKDEDYVEVALSTIRIIITSFGDLIRTSTTQQHSQLGVNVSAEERHEKCMRCMRQLTNLRVKATLLSDHMSRKQVQEFNALMQIFDDTLSPS